MNLSVFLPDDCTTAATNLLSEVETLKMKSTVDLQNAVKTVQANVNELQETLVKDINDRMALASANALASSLALLESERNKL